VEENKRERRNKTALNDTTATKDSSIITEILRVADYVARGREESVGLASVKAFKPLFHCKRLRLDGADGDAVT
jgi:hypothetical protein